MTSEQSLHYQRRLDLEGAPNIRDLGGYETADGGNTRWGRIFRAGRLSSLTENDKAALARYDLRVICDFRRAEESERDVTDLGDHSSLSIHNLAIAPGSHSGAMEDFDISQITGDDMAAFMVQINRELALHQTDTYRHMFELLLATDHGGFLFHCSAGKDRTGFAAALILAALGVERETIMADYLLTAQYYPPSGELEYLASKYLGDDNNIDLSAFQALMDTREEYLGAAFEAIDEHYDSLEHYLEEALGLNRARRQLLVERYVE